MKGGIGSISRRSFEVMHHLKGRSSGVVLDETQLKAESQEQQQQQQSCWANMPPELLRDVIQRIEASESVWPIRKHVVACAAVCSTWREITKELVDTPERSGKLTFPISLKQVRICFLTHIVWHWHLRNRGQFHVLLHLRVFVSLALTCKCRGFQS